LPQNPFIDFQNKKVIVTGVSSGIGRAICIELKKYNADLVLVGRDRDRLNKTAEEIDNQKNHIIVLDLSMVDNIFSTIKDSSAKIGPIYGLCHAAGVVETLPLNISSPHSIQKMIDVNLLAGLELARTLSRKDVMEKDGGSILFIASIFGSVGIPGQIAYSASKGGLIAAAKAMAIELARRNILVNTISPGLVKTPMTEKAFSKLSDHQRAEIEKAYPLGVGTPEDVARAAAFLLAPQNKWITGIDLVIDGGYTAK